MPSLSIVAVIQPDFLVEAVRFTLSDLPALVVSPIQGVFVLGPLGNVPFSVTSLLSDGVFQVAAVALDALANDVGSEFVASITIAGTETDEPTSSPTMRETNVPTSLPSPLLPVTDPPTLAPTSPATNAPFSSPASPPPTGTSPSTSEIAACMSYPSCPQVTGNCCPNVFGGYYACCWDGRGECSRSELIRFSSYNESQDRYCQHKSQRNSWACNLEQPMFQSVRSLGWSLQSVPRRE